MVQRRTTAQRLGGKWAISWRACSINAVLASLIFLTEGLSDAGSPGLGPWLALVLIALIPSLLLMVVLDRMAFRHRRDVPVSPLLVVIVNGVLGGLFNVSIWIGAEIAGIPTVSASVSSVITVVVISVWWGSALTIFFDYQEETRCERESLIDAAVKVEIVKMQQAQILNEMQDELTRQVDAELSPLRAEISLLSSGIDGPENGAKVTPESWSALADHLRSTAQGSIRPLSRELWKRTSETYPRTPWWSLLISIPRHQPLRPVLLVGVHITLTMWALLQLFGLARGLGLLAVESLAILVIGGAFNRLMKLFPRHHLMLFFAGILVLQMSIPLRAAVRESWKPGSATLGWQVTQFVVGVILIFVTSGIHGWVDETGQVRDVFRRRTDEAMIAALARSQQMATLARDTARLIHGSVQTRLVACAIAIDQATQVQDLNRLNAALREAIDVLETPLLTPLCSSTLEDEVVRKTNLWLGICDVELIIEDEARTWPGAVAQVGLIVEEGLANAVRRGEASWARVTLAAVTHQDIRICVEDDGNGPGGGPPGVGSAIIEQISDGRWSLSASSRGSILTAIVTAKQGSGN